VNAEMLKKTAPRKLKSFRELDMWRLGKTIVIEIYRLTRSFPKEELYGLTSQMRRAAISIPANIAEGFNRRHNAEFRQLLYVALGSCAELETQIEIAHDLAFITASELSSILENLDHESRMLRNLIKLL
jgi:four helix bundle protein